MKFILLTLCLFAVPRLGANADTFPTIMTQEVTISSLQLLGRGVENRETHEVINFACTSEKCDQIQSVYFNSTGEKVYFFGNPIKLNEFNEAMTQQKAIKLAFKKISKKYRDEKNEENRFRRHKLYVGSAIALVSLTALAITPIPLAIATSIAITGGVVYITGTLISVYGGPFSQQHSLATAFHDQNGWNWSVSPKTISSKNFETIVKMQKTETSDLAPLRN